MPVVSIVMPAYNAAPFIGKAIESLLAQQFKDYAIIVLDDGSTDNTREILDRLSSHKKLTIHSRENRGTTHSRNDLLRIVRGQSEYIAWCDADDVYHPEKLKTQIEFLGANRSVIGCGTWYRCFGRRRKSVRKFIGPIYNKYACLFGAPVGFPTFVQRQAPGIEFDTTFSSAEDYDYLLRLIQQGEVVNINRYLTNYRVHDSQQSSANTHRQLAEHRQIMRRAFAEVLGLSLSDENQERLLFPVGPASNGGILGKLIVDIEKHVPTNELCYFRAVANYRMLVFNKWKLAIFRNALGLDLRDWSDIVKAFTPICQS